MFKKNLQTVTLLLGLLNGMFGCASIPVVGTPGNLIKGTALKPDQINWPERYDPKKSSLFVHNEILIDAPPEVIWNLLIQAETWPSWYSGAANVKVTSEKDGILRANSTMRWLTMGQDLTTHVREFEPPYRMGWESRKKTLKAYHAWLLVPSGNGTKLITDESQYGFLTLMQKIFVPNKLRRLHDVWLGEIKKRSEETYKKSK